MRLDRATVARAAAAAGFRESATEKVIRLGGFLTEIGRHPSLGPSLLLKGGTALNLCFGPPARLSVDLDFNYVRFEDREQMLRDRVDIETAMSRVAVAGGYRVQVSSDEHAGRKYYLGYASAAGTPDRIEVDLNYLHRVPLADPIRVECWQPGDFERPTVACVGIVELAGGKVCALLDRSAPRDLFDVTRLPEIAGAMWTSTALHNTFIALAGVLPHPVHAYGRDRLARIADRDIAQNLAPMLADAAQVESAQGLRNAAWQAVEHLTRLTTAQREFIDRLQAGEIAAALLFPADPAMQDRIARHPALRWKAENARTHREGGS